MTNKEKLLVFLSMFELSVQKQEELLSHMKEQTIENLLDSDECVNLLSAETFHKMVKSYDRRAFENSLSNMENAGIKLLSYENEDYPKRLKDLPERPLLLYAKGDLSLLKQKCFAIVGTRMPSNYGKLVTEKFVSTLAEAGLVIVSGLCYGVDEIAHRKTLEVGGKTIAIVGSGFNNIYPSTNTPLSKEIEEKGLLLSEYPPSFKARRYTFPKRNRIIVGISDGVLITEAGFKSGTIHTKEYAIEFGRDIFAVPGNINNSKSDLPNHIIKTGQAQCVTEPDDIIEAYGLEKKLAEKKVVSVNMDEQIVIDLLRDGEKDFEYLLEKSQISVKNLNVCLTTLEIRGLIRKLPGQFYAAK